MFQFFRKKIKKSTNDYDEILNAIKNCNKTTYVMNWIVYKDSSTVERIVYKLNSLGYSVTYVPYNKGFEITAFIGR